MTATIHRITSRNDSPVPPLKYVQAEIHRERAGDMAEFLAVKRIIPIRRKPDLSLWVPLACGAAVIGWGVAVFLAWPWVQMYLGVK